MESTYTTFNIIVAFWASGVFMAFISLWLPAIKIIGVMEPDNLAYRYRFLGAVLFIMFTTVLLPIMVHIILVDRHREKFLRAFIPAYLGREKDE
tara:strand:+ start:401 stop:682 length:282 start_codon:yes stop_codon:yes gene_type:complete